MAAHTALIAIDWGTTRVRAYRVDPAGRITDERSAELGVQKLDGLPFREAFDGLLGDWRGLAVPRIACGMVGSRQGWVEAPYLRCPVSLGSLGDALVTTKGGELAIVPGLLTRDAGGVPDVMRGEETQLLGAIATPMPRTLAVLPGSHSKWAIVEDGTVLDFATFMTGEIYEALLRHTILGRLARWPSGDGDPAAFARGVERGLGAGGFTHDVFGARTLVLQGELDEPGAGEWLSGVMIGREIRTARSWAQRAGHDASRVLVVGGESLAARYTRALGLAGVAAEAGVSDAAARGLFRIARAGGRLAA